MTYGKLILTDGGVNRKFAGSARSAGAPWAYPVHMLYRVLGGFVLAAVILGNAAAQSPPPTNPCEAPEHRAMDFWVGSGV
jgi:hypothetical protein